jgi:hypothetical protein
VIEQSRTAASTSRRLTGRFCIGGLDLAIARGWLAIHASGTFVRFTQADAELFA